MTAEPMGPQSVLGKSYAERQFLVVLDDVLMPMVRKHHQTADGMSGADGAQELFLGELPMRAAFEMVRALKKMQAGGFRILAISRAQSRALAFPVGHPRDGLLYVGHPAVASAYCPMAQFHRLTFEHKCAEAIQLLMALGATRMEVEHVVGWSTEARAEIVVSVPQSVQVGGQIEVLDHGRRRILFAADLNGVQMPALPDGLVWYAFEPAWQRIAEGRLQYGLSRFCLEIRYEDDFGVNAGLKMTAVRAGLEIGGVFGDHEITVWKIRGAFGEAGGSERPVPGLDL